MMLRFCRRPIECTPNVRGRSLSWSIGMRCSRTNWNEGRYDPPKSGSRSSKRSNPDTKEAGDEGVSGSERPEGRKATNIRLKEKANNTVVDLITTQLKELKSANTDMNEIFKSFITIAKEEEAQKMMMREQKLRREEDRIMMMDASIMTPEQVAY